MSPLLLPLPSLLLVLQAQGAAPGMEAGVIRLSNPRMIGAMNVSSNVKVLVMAVGLL